MASERFIETNAFANALANQIAQQQSLILFGGGGTAEQPELNNLRKEVNMIDASKWTGGNDLPKIKAIDLLVRDRPAVPSSKEPLAAASDIDSRRRLNDEYASIAASIGFLHQHIDTDLSIEDFKAFLRAKDWAVFNLSAVVAYMDKKAKAESNNNSGWEWRPLRAKDNLKGRTTFGRVGYNQSGHITPASDFYAANMEKYNYAIGRNETGPSSGPYDKLVPLHALKKVAAIEKEFKGPVSFFIADYAPAPHIHNPDPFLMAVIDNAKLRDGIGRFVIDFWDEPGFGLAEQLK